MSSDFDNRRHRHALVSALSIYLPIQVRCPAIQRMRDRCAAFAWGNTRVEEDNLVSQSNSQSV